jgi:Na+/proline symporter
VFDLSWNLSSTYTLWSGVIGGAFLTTASHGTDQLIVQRLLSASNERSAKLALIVSGGAVLLLFSLFLLIGTMLYVFYSRLAPGVSFNRTDSIFPTFISTRMAHGISGLLISAILAAAMSNLSAALNSLSSTTIVDFYARFAAPTGARDLVRLSRLTTLAWGLILFGLALMARHGSKVLEMGLSIASVAYGSLLGVFLLGALCKSANEGGAMVGMLIGLLVNLYLWQFTHVAFTWYVAIGSVATYLSGFVVSHLIKEPSSGIQADQVG